MDSVCLATEAQPTTTVEYKVLTDDELERPYRVILQNDDETPMEVVVLLLQEVFELPIDKAIAVMKEAHLTDHALVAVLPYQEAHDRIYRAHSLARAFGFPLTFFLEPDF